MRDAANTVDARSPWSRRAWIGLAVLVVGMLAALPFVTSSSYDASNDANDASIYVATARAMLVGHGYSYLGEPFIVRPPGFAVLVAGVLRVFGDDFFALNLMVSAFGAVACALLYALCVPRLGALLSFVVAAALFLNGEFRHMSNQVMSDVPGLAVLLACLLLEQWTDRRRSTRGEIVLGLAIGLGAYVRTSTLLLVPAIALARVFARERETLAPVFPGKRETLARVFPGERENGQPISRLLRARVAVLGVTALACIAPWSVRCAMSHPAAPVDQTFLYSYGTGLWHERPYDPDSPTLSLGAIAGRVPERAGQIVPSALVPVREVPDQRNPMIFGAFLLASLAWLLAEKRRASEFYLLCYLGVLAIYFAFRPRLMLPIWALGIPGVVEFCLAHITSDPFRKAARWIALVGIALVPFVSPPLALAEREVDERDAAYVAAANAVRTALPADTDVRIASAIGWHWSVYLGREVFSLALAARRSGTSGMQDLLAKRRIDVVILADFLPEDQALVPWFTQAWGDPERAGGVSIFHRPE